MNEWKADELRGSPYCLLTVTGTGCPDALTDTPVFSWRVVGAAGAQQAYRLHLEEKGSGPVWDSGWIESARSCAVPYGGERLLQNRSYAARVTVRAQDGREYACARPAAFHTGFFGEWTAPWLRQPLCVSAAPMFRGRFHAGEAVREAWLFVCGLGYCDAFLNGNLIGDHRLDPAWTDYSKRVAYVAHDVTALIREGENALGIVLGHGWYAGELQTQPTFSLRLILLYEDGREQVVESGADSWRFFGNGPIVSNSIYIGEEYDARRERDGWSEPGFDDREWLRPLEAEPPAGSPSPQTGEPIRVVGSLSPVSVQNLRPGVYVVDFGQNVAGVMRLRGNEPAGTRIAIRFSELLNEAGELNTLNLREAQARDQYITRGGRFTYEPRFTYHGFRYAEISGLTEEPGPDAFTALALRNDVAVRGSFACSNSLIDKIQALCVWTESDNMHWVPTDCPQRDERLGWLNDLTVRAEEAVYNFDLFAFYSKFLTDISDAQGVRTGAIADTAPYVRYGQQPADGVCTSYLLLAWLLYCHYGDAGVLKKHYAGMAAWTEYMARQREDGIVAYGYYGDWASPITETIQGSLGAGAVSARTSVRLMSTGFLLLNARLMRQMARVLNKEEDARRYAALEAETCEALNRAFWNEEGGYYDAGSQGANAFMLYLGIVSEARRARVLENLVRDIRSRGIHTSTGNICSRYLYEVLSDNGELDLAYELVNQTSYPSWGYMLERGATTTWERWEYVDSGEELGMASHCHPMYSTISAWFYRYLAGVRPLEAGFDRFLFQPHMPRELQSASVRLKTVKGDISAEWRRGESVLWLRVEVPFNSECALEAPTGSGPADVRVDGKARGDFALRDGCVCLTLPSGVHVVEIDVQEAYA